MAAKIVVFDSNILIPLVLRKSRSTQLYFRLEAAGWRIAASPQLLNEVEEKLRTKESLRKWLLLSDDDITQFLQVVLPGMVDRVAGTIKTQGAVPDDPDDDMVIAAAIEADAAYIITNDKHLLKMKNFEGIRILNRRDFAVELDRLGVPDNP